MAATAVPWRPSGVTRPRSRRLRYPAATVAGLTPSSAASVRTAGSRSPGRSSPAAISLSIWPAMVAAPAPLPIVCTSERDIMYYNISQARLGRVGLGGVGLGGVGLGGVGLGRVGLGGVGLGRVGLGGVGLGRVGLGGVGLG